MCVPVCVSVRVCARVCMCVCACPRACTCTRMGTYVHVEDMGFPCSVMLCLVPLSQGQSLNLEQAGGQQPQPSSRLCALTR